MPEPNEIISAIYDEGSNTDESAEYDFVGITISVAKEPSQHSDTLEFHDRDETTDHGNSSDERDQKIGLRVADGEVEKMALGFHDRGRDDRRSGFLTRIDG